MVQGDRLTAEQLDPELFMWSLRRGFNLDAMPEEKIVFQFDLSGIPQRRSQKRSYWIVVEQNSRYGVKNSKNKF